MIDLHIHTTASDGQHTPEEIVKMSSQRGLAAIAIADHNTVESVAAAESAAHAAGIEFAPSVEFDTVYNGRDLHVLGYYIRYKSVECEKYIGEIYEAKLEQTKLRVKRLCELGFALDFDELMKLSEWRLPTGKQYIAAMKLYDKNFNNPDFMAFIDGPRSNSPYLNFYLDWLRAGRPAFVPLDVQPTFETIAKIKDLGGVPVLAHPSDTPVEDVNELSDNGLVGIEVYSSYHDEEMTEKFKKLAGERGLLITAGSDFHGADVKPDVELAGIPVTDYSIFENLKKAAGVD